MARGGAYGELISDCDGALGVGKEWWQPKSEQRDIVWQGHAAHANLSGKAMQRIEGTFDLDGP